ncbi:MAG: MFS transporter [Chloroflexota bacterium]|nr:MFS transporter [Chloroflexota bacterium]
MTVEVLPVASAARRTLLVTSVIHVMNDACFALLYPLLPFIAADLHLSYAQIGMVKASFSAASSVLQIPAGMLGERCGEALILLLGNLWVGLGLVLMAASGGYGLLLLAALVAGIGGNAQHPLATAIVSRAYVRARRATALGTLNFSGDLGKVIGTLVVSVIAVRGGWRMALVSVGGVTAALTLPLLIGRRATLPPVDVSDGVENGEEIHTATRPGFPFLLVVGALDTATRGAALTFLPFIFAREGVSAVAVSALFSLIFGAGAAGKFLCGWLGDRWGAGAVIVSTELVTALTLVGFITMPVWAIIPIAAFFGFALNGTSSVLSAAVAHFVPSHRRARGYGAYFTAALVSSALAPLVYGLLGDAAGLATVFIVMAAMTAGILLPLVPIWRTLAAMG